MRQWLRRILLLGMLAVTAFCASGCGALGFTMNPQELYRLPYLPAKYTTLNNQLNTILETGAEYAAPAADTNIQPVQLTDLDGDGWQEAVTFFRNAADEKPLKIYIFTARGDSYEPAAVIEGSGTGIYSIAYQDMDADGRMELAVGWRVNTDLLALTIYALRPNGPEELVRTDYVRYAVADLDENDFQELVVFRTNEEGVGVADYYDWQEGGLTARSSTRISATMAELSQQGRVTAGRLEDETPALFVTGVTTAAQVTTDILTARSGELINLVVSDLTGISREIAGFASLYPMDINGDGVTEVPRPEPSTGEEGYQRIDWKRYDAEGNDTVALSTYHNIEDGWYLRLPESWRDRVTALRGTGLDEAWVTFFLPEEDGKEPFLRITAITGPNRESRAVRGSRFNLSRQEETFYVAELLEASESWQDGLTEDQVREAFSPITTEWFVAEN